MPSILVIEDERANRFFMEKVLSSAGFDVRLASDGESGIASFRENKPNLVLCDINMPGMDGYSVLESLKSDDSINSIPFIFVTSLDGREEQRRGMCEGADDYLTKPFTAEELVKTVVSRLSRIEMLLHKTETSFFQDEIAILSRKVTCREREVLKLVGQGLTSKEIAARLAIRLNTVEVHRASLMRKLGAPNAAKLARWALIAEQIPSTKK